MNPRLLLIFSVIFASIGQVLFKKGMTAVSVPNLTSDILGLFRLIIHIIFSPLIFTGLVLYALSTLLWLFALSKLPLNYAYPFTLLTFVLVMLSASFILHEGVPLNRLIGAIVICAGVIIVSIK